MSLYELTNDFTQLFDQFDEISSMDNAEEFKQAWFDTLSGIIMLGVAICCGIIAVADNFIPFFLGSGYASCNTDTIQVHARRVLCLP